MLLTGSEWPYKLAILADQFMYLNYSNVRMGFKYNVKQHPSKAFIQKLTPLIISNREAASVGRVNFCMKKIFHNLKNA